MKKKKTPSTKSILHHALSGHLKTPKNITQPPTSLSLLCHSFSFSKGYTARTPNLCQKDMLMLLFLTNLLMFATLHPLLLPVLKPYHVFPLKPVSFVFASLFSTHISIENKYVWLTNLGFYWTRVQSLHCIDEDHVGNSLLQIWMPRFDHIANFLLIMETQGKTKFCDS